MNKVYYENTLEFSRMSVNVWLRLYTLYAYKAAYYHRHPEYT